MGYWLSHSRFSHSTSLGENAVNTTYADRPNTSTTESADYDFENELVETHLSLARSLARRYHGRGIDQDDLTQVAYLGLVQASRRFDGQKGDFPPFATATILGELKRHFRDRGWTVRPPRALQELQASVTRVTDDALQKSQRPPSAHEIAGELGVEVSDVREAQTAQQGFSANSLDDEGRDGEWSGLAHRLGTVDGRFERVDEVASVAPLLRALPECDRELVWLRFFQEKSQLEISTILGVSQMQISRRLKKLLDQLRRDVSLPKAA